MANNRFQTIPATTTMADLALIQENWDKVDSEMTRIESKEDGAVSNEQTARIATDSSLQTQITQEATARAAADTSHASSTTAHPAANITFDKKTSGMGSTDANAAIIEAYNRAGNIIAQSGTSSSEDVDARTLEPGYNAGRTITVFGDVMRDMQSRLKAAAIASAALKHGWNYLLTNDASPLSVTISGKTLVNILGKDGGCESLTGFTTSGTVATSTTQVKQGSNSIKFTSSAASSVAFKDYSYPLDTSKQYVLGCWVYIESYTSGTPTLNLRDFGTTTDRYTTNANTATVGSWQFIYIKVPTANTFVGTGFRLYFGTIGSGTCVAYYDSIRLYELDLNTYNAIGSTYTATTSPSIDDILPYVDSVQHLRGVSITKPGKNLLPPFTEWTLNANAVVTGQYALTLNATAASQSSYMVVNILPNTQYTFNLQVTASTGNAKIDIDQFDTNGNIVASFAPGSVAGASGTLTISFTSDANAKSVKAFITNDASGTFTFTNPQLELGTVATAFEAANPDYIYGVTDAAGNPLKLASSVDGSVKDSLYARNGQWYKEKRWSLDNVLDGSLAWVSSTDYTGFKRFDVPNYFGQSNTPIALMVKYNGQIVVRYSSAWNSGDLFLPNGNTLSMALYDTDTGFDNAYIPANNEIQAYFYGWKVNGYTAGTAITNEATGSIAANGTYTLAHAGKYKSVTVTKSTDNVTFTAATEGTDYTVNWSGTAMLTNPTAGALYYQITYTYGVTPNSWASVVDGSSPSTNTLAYVSANKAANYTPYSLSYQLATTVEEAVTVEGSIDTNAGGNQISVEEGYVIREVANPVLRPGNDFYLIDDTRYASTNLLKNKSEKIIAVYKNGIKDTQWQIISDFNAYGKQRASLPASNFDSLAVYTVTYQVYNNDKGGISANCTDVSASYNSTEKDILDSLNKSNADNATNITVLQETKANRNQSPWIAPTMQNAWVNYGGTDAVAGYMRDEFGWVNVKGRIKSGTIGQTAFALPAGYRPKETQRFAVSSNGAFGEVLVNTDGTIVPTVGSNVSFNVQIRFRAEQ